MDTDFRRVLTVMEPDAELEKLTTAAQLRCTSWRQTLRRLRRKLRVAGS